jgi:hypothetical protein
MTAIVQTTANYIAGKMDIDIPFNTTRDYIIKYNSPIFGILSKERSIAILLDNQEKVLFNIPEIFEDGFKIRITNNNPVLAKNAINWVSVYTKPINFNIAKGSLLTGLSIFTIDFFDLKSVSIRINTKGFKKPVIIMGEVNSISPLTFVKLEKIAPELFEVYYVVSDGKPFFGPGSVSYMVYEEGFYSP